MAQRGVRYLRFLRAQLTLWRRVFISCFCGPGLEITIFLNTVISPIHSWAENFVSSCHTKYYPVSPQVHFVTQMHRMSGAPPIPTDILEQYKYLSPCLSRGGRREHSISPPSVSTSMGARHLSSISLHQHVQTCLCCCCCVPRLLDLKARAIRRLGYGVELFPSGRSYFAILCWLCLTFSHV